MEVSSGGGGGGSQEGKKEVMSDMEEKEVESETGSEHGNNYSQSAGHSRSLVYCGSHTVMYNCSMELTVLYTYIAGPHYSTHKQRWYM